ncbi:MULTISPECIES: ATP-binding protein [unclassified Methylobacterium]|uniref:sensor histidine kinase n=1 Tax=unclassified Methylobacterium TaxID=2615210 RepID=UPI0006F8A014|nr:MULTISPECIES: ATP-binding protein [unclassified Methylobacterium]KQO65430.1 ATPase [Methylobacterium sp. Leaf88]KQU34370.1 ATPase [Methylobacterium sp. Leaf94]
MLAILSGFLDRTSLAPHGICLLWRPELIWTHVVSDAIIAFAYFTIPVALGVFVTRRRDIAFGWMFWAFALFILACGTTHLFGIWTLWVPDYAAEAVIKAITAAASIVTAILLWVLLPRALALPSPDQLRRANAELLARIGERDAALAALHEAHAERDRAEEMLRQSQKMEAIGALTGGVAHDFNNLLGVVISNLDRIERFLPPESGARRSLNGALTGAERAAALVQKMLAFARRQPLQPVRVDPNRLIRDLSELLRGALDAVERPEMTLTPQVWPVCVDANQLENALLNLAVNARDATEKGGRTVIRTRNVPAAEAEQIPALRPVDHVAIAVADSGQGMSPEVLARAFEPFFTTKAVGEGTGLGLSQVFGFAKQSDGHVVIESAPGRGTTVWIYLPRDPTELSSPHPSGEASRLGRTPRLGYA